MPGLKENELMHEWMQEDSPEYDIEPERIMLELVRDNELMLQIIRECGKEDELRNRIMMSCAINVNQAQQKGEWE